MQPETLPLTLWRDARLFLAPDLTAALKHELQIRHLFDEACGPNPKEDELFGGGSAADAIKHFTHRFKTSAARVEYVVLNPTGTFEAASSDLLAFFFDGKVSILDVPCGSGGGVAAFLCSVAELRRHNLLPATPVAVTIIAADVSPDARELHATILHQLLDPLARVGIRLNYHHVRWDVTDPFSTQQIMDFWFATCPDSEEYLVFVSAFSGFADKHIEPVLTAFHGIVARFHSKPCLLFWIEPAMKLSTRVLKLLTDWFSRLFSGALSHRSATTTEEFFFKHPFTDEQIRGRAQVRSFMRG